MATKHHTGTADAFQAPTTIAYGPHPDQVADFHLPASGPDGPVPLVMLLHGGFWRAEADRQHLEPVVEDLLGRGWAVANIEYRRVGAGGGWPTTFTDVAEAADALPDLIEKAQPGRVDFDRVVYVGHSAGGQLALWVALRHRTHKGAPGHAARAPRLAGVVALAPAADLAWAYDLGSGKGSVAELLGGGPEDFPERYAAVDPTALGAADVPVVVVHGDQDERLPVEMARRYADSVDAELIVPEGGTHFDLIDPQSAAWPLIAEAIRRVFNPASRGAVAMCYEAGRLVRVRHGVPVDAPTLVTTVVLDFERGSWALTVNADDDTVRIATAEALRSEDVRLDDAPAESPWTRALGASVQWIWLLRNQQGYDDGIQFSFAHDGQVDCQIQMSAAASGWRFATVQHWVPDANSE